MPKDIEDSTTRKEEARRTKRGTSILSEEVSPAQWGLLQAFTFIGGFPPATAACYWCLQALGVSACEIIEPV